MEQKDATNPDYVPFRVSTLRGDQKIEFNAYIKLNEKHILYVRKGDSFEGLRLNRLKEKKLKKMYLRSEEEPSYRTYLERNIEMAYDKGSGKTISNRAEIIQGNQQSKAEELMENSNNASVYNEAKTSMDRFMNFIQTEEDALSAMIGIENVDQNIAHHGVSVASYSALLAQKVGVTDGKQLQFLGLGALLHDYDHYKNGLNIARPVSAFNKDELKIYKAHPQKAIDELKEKRHFDAQVIKIIHQHEETIDGRGFPQGLQERDIDPLALIVGCCNALDRIITFEGTAKKEAAKKLTISKIGVYPLKYMQYMSEIMAKFKNQ